MSLVYLRQWDTVAIVLHLGTIFTLPALYDIVRQLGRH